MGKGYKHGGSGGANPLNFIVKTYPSEVELKANNPKEITIGVITITTMTSWVFSATEPSEPEVGMVWFPVGKFSKSEFNALKKNTLQVYPLTAKQYEGGKWVDKVAYSYQNGVWTQWLAGYYYKAGVGSTVGEWQAKYQTGNTQNSIEFNEDGIKYNFNHADYSALIAFSPIQDLTNVSKLVFRLRGNNTWFRVGAASAVFDAGSNHFVAQSEVDYFTGEQEVSVDVSSLSGNYYIAAYGSPQNLPSVAYCYDVQGVE